MGKRPAMEPQLGELGHRPFTRTTLGRTSPITPCPAVIRPITATSDDPDRVGRQRQKVGTLPEASRAGRRVGCSTLLRAPLCWPLEAVPGDAARVHPLACGTSPTPRGSRYKAGRSLPKVGRSEMGPSVRMDPGIAGSLPQRSRSRSTALPTSSASAERSSRRTMRPPAGSSIVQRSPVSSASIRTVGPVGAPDCARPVATKMSRNSSIPSAATLGSIGSAAPVAPIWASHR